MTCHSSPIQKGEEKCNGKYENILTGLTWNDDEGWSYRTELNTQQHIYNKDLYNDPY